MKRTITRLLAAAIAAFVVAPAAALNLSNEDIDIFLNNPDIVSARPNVLIIWDNTANWAQTVDSSTAYEIEKSALSTVISGLTDQFNVGLMLFTETGGGNSTVRGTYPRYHIRQMTAANKTSFTTLISGLGKLGDKGSNAQYARGMHEAYLYYGGKRPMAGDGQVKRDTAAFNEGRYRSPISSACQKNFIIFISNGTTDSGENASAEGLLAGLGGKLTGDPIALTPSNEQANWADEYARFMHSADCNTSIDGVQNIYTYTLAVYDSSKANTNPVKGQIALMKSMANQGKGKYFAATSSQAIVDALNTIFSEVQAVNSVFSSTTLPVSVNVRGTNLNQVYIGVFRPDPNLQPRWFGNLKLYKLGFDEATESLFLQDATGAQAESASTGFIAPGATSYWTSDSTYWGFRSGDQNGAGGSSDSPDGDLVEKGGAGQKLRTTYATSQAARKTWTCTGTCTGGSTLSGTPFATSNADVSVAALGVADATARDNLIDWVRGQDNKDDENADGSSTDVRASVHGDVLHSKPAVINFNRNGDDNDIYVFYGANDGAFHAVKGAFGTGAGNEAWSFVPSEFFGRLKRLRDNNPIISAANRKPYFVDGPIGVYQYDANNDGKLVASDGDKVYLYLAMRRGGRLIYALDVSDPDAPRMLWKKDNTSTGFAELGQTWSEPIVGKVKGHANPVVVFGGGYDQSAEDTYPKGTNTMGRAIYVVDAITGTLVWQAGPSPAGATHNLTVAGMTHAIPSDTAAIDTDRDGFLDRVYVGDTGGNVWRVDIDDVTPASWQVYKLAAVGGNRKFLQAPDVVVGSDANGPFHAVLMGSGDREKPFSTAVTNRFYMFKDRKTGKSAAGMTASTEADLFDATSNALQVGTADQQAAAQTALLNAAGWYVTLGSGEKVVGSTVTIAGTTFFNTNQPSSAAGEDLEECSSNLGIARQYMLSYADATANMENNAVAGFSTADRSTVHAGGGFLPSPVHVAVSVTTSSGERVIEGVVSGTSVLTKKTTPPYSRYRVYWYIERDTR